MPTTIGQHTVATFTSPVNGTTPIDANTVRGNDNTIRTSYNNHDSDPGIHVQSSTLASRPVAGTAGRKWITADAGSYKLWYDDGTRWHEIGNDAVDIAVVADETLVKGDVLSITGFNNGLNLPRVAKYTGASPAFAVAAEAIANGAQGYVINTGLINDLNTNAFGAIGTILYPAATGTFTATKPVSGTYQTAAYVLRQNSSNGALYVEFSAPRIVERSDNTASTVVLRDASGNFSAGTITATLSGSITGNAATATALQTARNINGVSFNGTADITVTAAAGTLTGTTLASNVVSSSLTSVGTLTNLTVTNTITGSVSGSSGSTTGNAATATALQTARTINGVSFNGTADITVTAAAGTLSGNTLASGVTASSLTSVGTLTSLTVSGNGVFGPENGRSVDTSYIRVYGGTIATAGANLLVFGDSHPSAPGRLSLSASGTGHVEINTGGFQRLLLDASGNLGLGVTPSAWDASFRALQVGSGTPFAMDSSGAIGLNYFYDGAYKYVGNSTATLYSLASGQHRWYVAASGTAGNAITFTQALTLNANGGLQTLNTIGVGNTTPATSGAGISFPATQSASSDANTLDDYEEGTWVPTLTNLTLGNAVTAFRYVKVGQMVTLDIVIEWGSTTSSSGQWRISLPFNAQATGGGSAYLYDDTGSEYVVPATVYTASFGQTLVIGSGSGAGFVTNTAPFTWAQNDRFGCSITYRATA
jgi:hypothetical protein